VLQRPECNFLADIAEEDFCQVRSTIIDLVLGTDMAQGKTIQSSFKAAFAQSPRVSSTNNMSLMLQMAMKCADLGHLTLDWEVHTKWVSRIEAEFFGQGDKEKAAGIPVSFLMDRNQPGCSETQTGFFEFVALPLLQLLVEVVPAARPLLQGAIANQQRWRDLDGARNCVSTDARSSQLQDPEVIMTSSDGSDDMKSAESDALDEITHSMSCTSSVSTAASASMLSQTRKKSGRSRQRAAKWRASVRCRTPSPEPGLPHHIFTSKVPHFD
jgi:hypothetical protein